MLLSNLWVSITVVSDSLTDVSDSLTDVSDSLTDVSDSLTDHEVHATMPHVELCVCTVQISCVYTSMPV